MAYTTINKSTDYFNTKLYTGNGSTQSITGVGFQPDWTWIKSRNSASYNHMLFDAVRGATKYIKSDATSAENTLTETLKSFNSDGFTVGTEADVNNNSTTYASWNWKANGAGSTNYDGSINSTVSANTTAGFSIVKYTGNGTAGATIGHGLGATPAVIIQKIRGSTGNWLVYHHKNTSAPETDFLKLNTTDATADEVTIFNDTAPTSSVFSVGTESTINGNGNTCIAYCFAEKKGYSKFGSYTGNGTAGVDGAGDGNFIYTGFKPSMIIIKPSSTTGNWQIFDNKRPGFNESDNLAPNNNAAENTSNDFVDLVSNGFKLRSGTYSASGVTYIYMAFGQSLVGSNNVPCTAR